MITRDVEILYEKKQLVLEQQVQSSAIVSNFVAGSIQSQVSKVEAKEALSAKPFGGVFSTCTLTRPARIRKCSHAYRHIQWDVH